MKPGKTNTEYLAWLQKKGRTLLEQRAREVLNSVTPQVCGICTFCDEHEYQGSTMYTCGHKNGPDRDGNPGLVLPGDCPPMWCPRRHGLVAETIVLLTGRK